MCAAVAALAAVRLWPHGGPESTTALSRVELQPRDVRGMPILWLGDSYDSDGDGTPDMPLRLAKLETTAAFYDPRDGREIHPATTSYSMIYGTCTPPTPRPGGEQFGCPVPLAIDFFGVCNTPPLSTDAMPRVPVRGVDAFEVSADHIWIETADFTVSVMAWGKTIDEGKAHALQVVQNLMGANPEAAAFGRGTAFHALTSASACNLPSGR